MALDSVGGASSVSPSSTPYAYNPNLDTGFAPPAGIHGTDFDQIAARYSPADGETKGEFQNRREAALEGLSPVDQGRLLRAFDKADAQAIAQSGGSNDNGVDLSNVMSFQAKAPSTTRRPAPPVAEANLKTFDKAKSPSEAPVTLKLPANVQSEAEKARIASINNGSASVTDSAIVANKKSGALKYVPVGGEYDSKKETPIGRLTTIPNGTGEIITPEMGSAFVQLSSSNETVEMRQNGAQQAMLVKTEKSAKNIDAATLQREYVANYNERIKAGFSESDAIKYANMEAAQKYGYAYYEGKGGTLNRVDTSKAGDPGFQSKPPAENPNKVAISNDYLGASSVDDAPANLNLNAAVQTGLDVAAKNSFPGGKPMEQGGVLLFDRTTGQMVVDKYDTQKSTSISITGAYTVKDPGRYVNAGSYHTHPGQEITGTDGTKGSAAETFSPTDIVDFVNKGASVKVVQYATKDGKDKSQYMMVRTSETVATVTEQDVVARINSYLDQISNASKKAGTNPSADSQYRLAVDLTLKELGVAAYAGENGKFTKYN